MTPEETSEFEVRCKDFLQRCAIDGASGVRIGAIIMKT